VKRGIVSVLVLCFLSVSTGLAQSAQARRPDFSPKAAGISLAAMKKPDAIAPIPKQNGKKSFWKSPWPYVIAGAVIAGVIIATKGYDDSPSGGYQAPAGNLQNR
jgi:hypothetical protein